MGGKISCPFTTKTSTYLMVLIQQTMFNWLCFIFFLLWLIYFISCRKIQKSRKKSTHSLVLASLMWGSGHFFAHEYCCFSSRRGPSWSANQTSASLTVSIVLVPQCWKVKASVPTVERRPLRPRRSLSQRPTPPPPCPLCSHKDLPRLGSQRAELTPQLAGKLPTVVYWRVYIVNVSSILVNTQEQINIFSPFVFSSSRLAIGAEVSGRADSSLPIRSSHGLDTSAVPGSSRNAILQAGTGTTEPPSVHQGHPRETLESILVALDTEK